jgi:amino acid transporter
VERGLPIFIALSAFGNLIATTYTRCRVDQEFAKQRILPFSKYWARNSPYGTPVGGLTLHWLFTVILILATPNKANGEAYTLVSNLFVYGQAWVSLFAAIGIIILKYHHKFREWTPAVIKNFPILYALAAFYVLLNLFIIVLLWWPPDQQGVISSYVTPGVSTALLGAGVVYWAIFAKVLPAVGYEIDDEPEELADGTVVVTYKRHLTGWAKRVHVKWKSGWGGRFGGGGMGGESD